VTRWTQEQLDEYKARVEGWFRHRVSSVPENSPAQNPRGGEKMFWFIIILWNIIGLICFIGASGLLGDELSKDKINQANAFVGAVLFIAGPLTWVFYGVFSLIVYSAKQHDRWDPK
jgi:uncharacterized membrane protein YhaH (DUF805 family)